MRCQYCLEQRTTVDHICQVRVRELHETGVSPGKPRLRHREGTTPGIFDCAIFDPTEFDAIYGLLRALQAGAVHTVMDANSSLILADEHIEHTEAGVRYTRKWLV